MSHFKVLQVCVPAQHFDGFVETMKQNGCKVDDLCSVSSTGRVVNVWIPPEDLEDEYLYEKVGDFL